MMERVRPAPINTTTGATNMLTPGLSPWMRIGRMVTPSARVQLYRISNDQLYHYYLGDPWKSFSCALKEVSSEPLSDQTYAVTKSSNSRFRAILFTPRGWPRADDGSLARVQNGRRRAFRRRNWQPGLACRRVSRSGHRSARYSRICAVPSEACMNARAMSASPGSASGSVSD